MKSNNDSKQFGQNQKRIGENFCNQPNSLTQKPICSSLKSTLINSKKVKQNREGSPKVEPHFACPKRRNRPPFEGDHRWRAGDGESEWSLRGRKCKPKIWKWKGNDEGGESRHSTAVGARHCRKRSRTAEKKWRQWGREEEVESRWREVCVWGCVLSKGERRLIYIQLKLGLMAQQVN